MRIISSLICMYASLNIQHKPALSHFHGLFHKLPLQNLSRSIPHCPSIHPSLAECLLQRKSPIIPISSYQAAIFPTMYFFMGLLSFLPYIQKALSSSGKATRKKIDKRDISSVIMLCAMSCYSKQYDTKYRSSWK